MSDLGKVIEFRKKTFCRHNSLIVDEDLEKIECKNCGEKLNPFFAIRKLMQLSEVWKKQKAEADLSRENAEKKTKTKCEHCGKMTRIKNIKPTFAEICERANDIKKT